MALTDLELAGSNGDGGRSSETVDHRVWDIVHYETYNIQTIPTHSLSNYL